MENKHVYSLKKKKSHLSSTCRGGPQGKDEREQWAGTGGRDETGAGRVGEKNEEKQQPRNKGEKNSSFKSRLKT